MTIKINVPELRELKPRIVVLGVGGAGGNAINNMIDFSKFREEARKKAKTLRSDLKWS